MKTIYCVDDGLVCVVCVCRVGGRGVGDTILSTCNICFCLYSLDLELC